MMSTGSVSAAQGRQPAQAVLINGTQAPCSEWEVTNNGYYRADTFSATFPVSSLPKGVQTADLADAQAITVEIRLSTGGGSPVSLIIGVVSDFDQDWRGGTITVSGRDHTGDFIDVKTGEKFQNQTSSQIVQTLAARHGLTADVDATSTPSGRYYEIDHDRLTDEITEWDLITYLAQKEGYFAWVTGTTLHFKSASAVVGTPIPIQWTPASATRSAVAPFVSLHTRRNLTLAPGAQVIVWSWNHKQKQSFKVTAKATKSQKSQSSGGQAQVYTFITPGLTKDQATQLAQSKLEEITRHEKTIELEFAPDVTTTPRNQIQIKGTGTDWDQLYWIDEVTRRMSFEHLEMTVKGKNHSPQSTVVA